MKKPLISLCALAVCLSGCEPLAPVSLGQEVPAGLSLDSVYLNEGSTLKFFFYISTEEALRVRYAYISGPDDTNPESGTLCYSASSPESCELKVNQYSQPFFVKTTYEDGNFSINKMNVPVPPDLEEPTIVNPVETPERGSTLDLRFKDVGASSYEVRITSCGEYQNDGINPCLDQSLYTIEMNGGEPMISPYDSAWNPVATLQNGIITLRSDLELYFPDRLEYSVTAVRKTLTDGVKTVVQKTASASFAPL